MAIPFKVFQSFCSSWRKSRGLRRATGLPGRRNYSPLVSECSSEGPGEGRRLGVKLPHISGVFCLHCAPRIEIKLLLT